MTTLWKKNITLDFVSGDILFPECDIFSLVWSSTIIPSTKGSMFIIYLLSFEILIFRSSQPVRDDNRSIFFCMDDFNPGATCIFRVIT